MEHIITVALQLDDDKINAYLEDKAKQDVINEIIRKIESDYRRKYYVQSYESVFAKIAEGAAENWIGNHRDEFVEAVAQVLYEKVARAKKITEAKKAVEG